MKKFYFVAVFVTLVALFGCSTAVDEGCDVEVAKSELSIGLPIGVNRTAVDDAGKSSWVEGDSFLFWAKNRTGGYVVNAAEFEMMYYWLSMQSAVFTSGMNSLSEGTYTYYAVSPKPNSVTNRVATYVIPAEQQGESFNGAYDIMVATPLQAEAVVADKVNNLALEFNHKMHTLKMTIPEDGNPLADAIARVVFDFPTGVVGTVAVDATNPDKALTVSESKNSLTINVVDGFDEGESAWATILPTSISGDVTYYAVSTVGQRTLTRTFKMSKECLAGHITPLSLTIPEPILPTIIRFKVGKNNLGEALTKIHIVDSSNKVVKVFEPNTSNTYDWIEYGLFEEGTFKNYSNKSFTIRFESQHAIVERKITLPTINKYSVHTLATIDVPFLFFEDFSSIHTSFDKDDKRVDNLRTADGMLLNDYMSVSGWNGAHIKGVAGKSVRVNVRHQSTLGATRTNGRLDSPAMKCLKAGANVKLKVEFDMGAYANSGYNKNNEIFCTAGMHTTPESQVINGIMTETVAGAEINDYKRVPEMFSSVCLTTGYLPRNCGDDSFSATFSTFSFTAAGCTKETRFGWVPCCIQEIWVTAGNAHYYIYLDNIRVSIAQ